MKKILYILPGWGEKTTQKNWKSLISFAKNKYKIVPIKYISKKGRLFSKNLELVKEQIKNTSKKDIILGFSIGALIAYQLASEIKFKLAIICSISSLLEKDLDLYPKKDVSKLFTLKQIEEMNSTKYKKPISKTILFYGSKEDEIVKRSEKLSKKFKIKSIIINGFDHDFSGKYLETVKKFL